MYISTFRFTLFAAAAVLTPAFSEAALITFDEAADQLSQFNLLDRNNATTTTGFVEAAGQGIGSPASVGVNHVAGGNPFWVSGIYRGEVFDLTNNAPITISQFFRVSAFSTSNFDAVLLLGLSQSTTAGFNPALGTGFGGIGGLLTTTETAGSGSQNEGSGRGQHGREGHGEECGCFHNRKVKDVS